MTADFWVYIAYTVDGELLYVGTTGQGMKRLHDHRRGSPWAQHVCDIKVEHYSTAEDALAREWELLTELEPPYNRTGRGRPTGLKLRDDEMSVAQAAAVLDVREQVVESLVFCGHLKARAHPTSSGSEYAIEAASFEVFKQYGLRPILSASIASKEPHA